LEESNQKELHTITVCQKYTYSVIEGTHVKKQALCLNSNVQQQSCKLN